MPTSNLSVAASHWPTPYWEDMPTTAFGGAEARNWIVVLPVAAIEQHGPHLPVGTDKHIGEGHVAAVVDRLPTTLPVSFLPLQAVGKSNEHISSPGTLTLCWETATKAWLEIGDSVARAGVRKMVIVTSHGGNVAIDDIIARELRVRHDMLVVPTAWGKQGAIENTYPQEEALYGIHGGDVETSLMRHLKPHLVNMDEAIDFRSNQLEAIDTFTHLRLHGPNPIGWKAQDLHLAGTVGNAANATAAKGAATLQHNAERFIELLSDIHSFSLERLWTDNPTQP